MCSLMYMVKLPWSSHSLWLNSRLYSSQLPPQWAGIWPAAYNRNFPDLWLQIQAVSGSVKQPKVTEDLIVELRNIVHVYDLKESDTLHSKNWSTHRTFRHRHKCCIQHQVTNLAFIANTFGFESLTMTIPIGLSISLYTWNLPSPGRPDALPAYPYTQRKHGLVIIRLNECFRYVPTIAVMVATRSSHPPWL